MADDAPRPDRNPVVDLAALPLSAQTHGDSFAAAMAAVAAPAGARRLGARLVVVPPGKKAWPHHSHHANDELFVVLSGEGVFRFGEDRHPVTAGQVAVAPAGGAETAHQMINTGSAELRYLAVSTMNAPDIMTYPDSGKVGAFAGAAPGGNKAERTFAGFFPADATVDYWHGEGD